MKILIANPGSTSYKCKLYDTSIMDVLFQASVERIGDVEGIYSYNFNSSERKIVRQKIPDYFTAVKITLDTLAEQYSIEDLNAVGFKTVHAKGVNGCVELTDDVLKAMQEYRLLAPVQLDSWHFCHLYLRTI